MRGVPRWLAVLAVLAITAAVCAFTARLAFAPASLVLQLSEPILAADGFSSSEVKIRSSNGRSLHGLRLALEPPHRAVVDSLSIEGDAATASLRSGVLPGKARLRITAPGFAPQEIELRTTLDTGDALGDGTPDFLRLHDPTDRLAFRRWFTLLAESQYFHGSAHAPEIDDCAALLRFAYREALREHDGTWALAMALPVPASAGDIEQYKYPYTPLQAALFRVRGGNFQASDLTDGAFAQFADVETLWRYNTFRVGRDLSRARPGDLLFFRQDSDHRMPFHAMIFLDASQIESGHEPFVVYHTGPTGRVAGEIRRLSIAEVLNYPDPRWRPIASNPSFLGVYRWNILRGSE